MKKSMAKLQVYTEGKEEIFTEQIKKKLAKNKTPEEIADALETDISVINRIIERINK